MTRPWGMKVAVVEPTTLLGKDVRAVLSERSFPAAKTLLFHAASVREAILAAGDEEDTEIVAPLENDSLEGCQVAFLCGGGDALREFVGVRTDSCLAIDLSGLRSGGPFVLPREEGGAPLPAGNLFLTTDPTAYVVWQALRRLARLGTLAGVSVAVDRPASELGRAALDELFRQAIALASFQSMPKEIFPGQSAFNIYHPDDSEAWEERLREDVLRLLGEEIPLSVFSARAGVFHGHHVRLEARFSGASPAASEVHEALFSPGSGFVEPDPESADGPVESAGRDETLVLRVGVSEEAVRLALASDHLRRGGAHLAVRIAEEAVADRGLLPDA